MTQQLKFTVAYPPDNESVSFFQQVLSVLKSSPEKTIRLFTNMNKFHVLLATLVGSVVMMMAPFGRSKKDRLLAKYKKPVALDEKKMIKTYAGLRNEGATC